VSHNFEAAFELAVPVFLDLAHVSHTQDLQLVAIEVCAAYKHSTSQWV